MALGRLADPADEDGIVEQVVVGLMAEAPAWGIRRVSLNVAVFRSVFARGKRLGAGPVLRLLALRPSRRLAVLADRVSLPGEREVPAGADAKVRVLPVQQRRSSGLDGRAASRGVRGGAALVAATGRGLSRALRKGAREVGKMPDSREASYREPGAEAEPPGSPGPKPTHPRQRFSRRTRCTRRTTPTPLSTWPVTGPTRRQPKPLSGVRPGRHGPEQAGSPKSTLRVTVEDRSSSVGSSTSVSATRPDRAGARRVRRSPTRAAPTVTCGSATGRAIGFSS